MSAKIIDGKKIASLLLNKLKLDVEKLSRKPGLAVVQIGSNPASEVYVAKKITTCAAIGIESFKHKHESISEDELLKLIDKLNEDEKVDGILVQMPLPKGIDSRRIINRINPEKDVDGLHSSSMGNLATDCDTFIPCTPKGVMILLKESGVRLEGKHAVVVGRSNLVGKPLALLLLRENATVTVCHSKTEDLASHTKMADIIVAAVGKPNMIKGDMVKEGAIIVDVGTSKVDGKLVGDVDFEAVKTKARLITPVPGGVGPMTIAMLMDNTVQAARKRQSS